MRPLFEKKTSSRWWMMGFFVAIFFISSPFRVLAIAVDQPCWTDYPNNAGTPQPIAGLPNATDINKTASVCKGETTFQATCVNQGGIDSSGGWGCDPGLKCCIKPAKPLGQCYNNYVGEDRQQITNTTCVKTADLCASPKKSLGSGFGCPKVKDSSTPPQDVDQICCATLKAGAAGSSGTSGAAIPETGSTAAWKLQNPEGTGILLVSCTQDGNCSIDQLVQQGINFSKWLMGLAGALFLLVFVYGGAMYLASFGNSAYVTKGKTALTRGAIGIVLVMGAWTIVSYVATSLGYTPVGTGATSGGDSGSTAAQEDVCGTPADAESAGMSCITLDSTHVEGSGPGKYTCIGKKCLSKPKDKNYKCCKAN